MSEPDGFPVAGTQTLYFECPICGSNKAIVNQRLLQIPYYEDFHAISFICPDCGLRRADFANIDSKGSTRYEYSISTPEDFYTKVVRAVTGVVHIPEVGVSIKPASAPTTWIRNIEGILLDVIEKINIIINNPETEQQQVLAIERKELIQEALDGKISLTVIVEDPTGNSIIIPHNPEHLKVEQIEDFDPYDTTYADP